MPKQNPEPTDAPTADPQPVLTVPASSGRVEVWQIQMFNALCRDAGLDVFFDAYLAKKKENAKAAQVPITAADQRGTANRAAPLSDADMVEVFDSIDLSRIFAQIGTDAGMLSLTRCVLGLHPDEVEDREVGRRSMQDVYAAWPLFAQASVLPSAMLLGYASYIG